MAVESTAAVVAAIGLGALAAVGVGLIIYVIVKKVTAKPHTKNGSRNNNSEQQVGTLVTIDDVNPTPANTGLRHRSTGKKSDEEKQNLLNGVISQVTKPNLTTKEKSAYEKKIADLEKILAEKDPKIAQLEKLISDLQKGKETAPIQSAKVQEWLNHRYPAFHNETHIEDDVRSLDSISVDSVETGLSFGSTVSKIEGKPEVEVQKILTWDEMSANTKGNFSCLACEKGVETVTSCNHPYMCLECVSVLYPLHQYCSWCDKKLTGYEKVSC